MFDGVKRDQSWLSPELEAQRFGEAVKKKIQIPDTLFSERDINVACQGAEIKGV